MGLLSWLWGEKKAEAAKPPPPPEEKFRAVRARYDAAQTTEENRRWWANADALSPAAANAPDVRRRLRDRARYEVANNSYAKGIVLTLANDVIGTGPQLQLQLDDPDANNAVEQAFARWAKACGLAEKLRTMKMAKTADGETFARLVTNRELADPVKLDVWPFECDYVDDPWGGRAAPNARDGIEYDADGNPTFYHVAREHPGGGIQAPGDADRVPASQVIHWFRTDRPGQLRGVSEITPALGLFAQLRRYTLAVIAAAETAADFAAVLQSDAPPDGADPADPFESLEIERRMLTTLPGGWKMNQFRAEQPTTTYQMFKHELLNEIARCLNVPFNVAAGNSSAYNYASGRLDHQTYHKSNKVECSHCESATLARVFMAWLQEAMFIPGHLPAGLPPFGEWRYAWLWPGQEHVDPLKEASAQQIRLANCTTTYAAEFGRQGKDWEQELRQRAKERQLMDELGLTAEQTPAPADAGGDAADG